ncbi:ribonuclease H-like domain-containing protein [Mycena galopus ATCC 62051]|nr:ribonuclease H-like domain-containing protein [Mycena galopus ATCC 62051]
MPGQKGPLWKFFHQGAPQNKSHFKAYCLGCIESHRPAAAGNSDVIDVDADDAPSSLIDQADQEWFKNAVAVVPHVRGEKSAMLAHLMSCSRASTAAKKKAKELKKGKLADSRSDSDDDSDNDGAPSRKRKRFMQVEKSFKQTALKAFKGVDMPFSEAQRPLVQTQFLRATVSANLPFRWTVDPEVIKLFLMFRSAATDVMPTDKVVSGRLLDEEVVKVDKKVVKALKGKYATISSDGWKEKYSVTGVDATVGGKSYLIDLIHTRGKKKDGESMCAAFCEHIDKAEVDFGCIAVCYVCDNDGGSQLGRKLLIILRPWLIGPACCAHQGQLILVDYMRESPLGLETAEETTGLIGWINNHERVRDIFDEVQEQVNGTAVAYIMANLTRWTTHSLSFHRLLRLKTPLRQAAILRREDIVAGQVGAEKNKKAKAKMEKEANKYCDLLDNPRFWKNLQTVADDIEPICYITNINQGEKTRADQVLLGFAGVYLHFKRHPDPRVAAGMKRRIEKRWAAMDQDFFVTTMVLNHFEKTSRFGSQAGASVFPLRSVCMRLYRRIKSRPPPSPLTAVEKQASDAEQQIKEAQVSQAFLKYMSGLGIFADFEEDRANFEKIHGQDPILVWENMLSDPEVHELAEFAILLLGIAINQAGNERDFSAFKIKKTRLRNRLSFKKTEKMSKVAAALRAEHTAAGFIDTREKRKNHDDARVAELVAVPQYADIIDNGDESEEEGVGSRGLVNSRGAWRKVHAKWVVEARLAEMDIDAESESTDVLEPPAPLGTQKWLPCTLEKLFGGEINRPPQRAARKAFTREELLMELLPAEHSDEEPDDGELEGSGDDYMEDE